MRQKTALSSPAVSNAGAPSTTATLQNDEESTRNRRRTTAVEPLTSYRQQLAVLQPSNAPTPTYRHSFDSASRLASSKSSARRGSSHHTASSISSENFSDPALASVSPRKPKPCTSRAPSLTLQHTPSPSSRSSKPQAQSQSQSTATRDHHQRRTSSSPSAATTTTATTTTTNNNTSTATTNSNTVAAHSNSTSRTTPRNITPSRSFPQHSATTSLDPKSPSYHKRSPASRSSHGIETSSGPPPALSTRRSLAQEKSRKAVADRKSPNNNNNNSSSPSDCTISAEPGRKPRPTSSPSFNASMKKTTTTAMAESTNATAAPERKQHRASLPARTTSFLSREKDKMSPTLPRFHGTLRTVSDRTERDETAVDTGSSKDTSGEETKRSDDVFLNIAKDKAPSHRRTFSTRTEIPKSNAGVRTIPSRLQTNNRDSPTAPRSEYGLDQHSSSQHADPLSASHGSSTVRSPSSAHPLDETGRLRHFGSNSRSSMGHTRSRLSRANNNAELSSETSQNHQDGGHGSVQDVGSHRPYRSSLYGGARSSRRMSGLDGAERARFEAEKSRHDGTESTLSTNAPSTVWDELDDLKSRIKKLELTGRFPTSSAAAMSTVSGERPRTATTTVTTLSSSPKHARKGSSPPVDAEASHGASQIQNLLLTALAKAKPRLSPPVYKSLEATATDALALSGLLNSNSQQDSASSSHVNGHVSSDRQTKWKAESLCRSLTELCLALSENQGTPTTSNQRPTSRDTSTIRRVSGGETEAAVPNFSYRRSASHEPEDLHRNHGASSNSAAANGLRESRRSSMYNLSNGNQASDDVPDSPSTLHLPTPPTRLNRTSLLLRNRRLQQPEDQPQQPQQQQQYDDTQSMVSRPLSRAMTDANPSGKDRLSSRDRFSLNYSSPRTTTNVDDKPARDQQQQNQQPSIPYRRNYVSPSTNLPAAPQTTIQPGFRRYASSGRSLADPASSERLSDGVSSRPQQQDSQSLGTTPPSRSATHHSSLQQLRSRTNSVSGRRLGFRPRQLTVGANNNGMAYDGVD